MTYDCLKSRRGIWDGNENLKATLWGHTEETDNFTNPFSAMTLCATVCSSHVCFSSHLRTGGHKSSVYEEERVNPVLLRKHDTVNTCEIRQYLWKEK